MRRDIAGILLAHPGPWGSKGLCKEEFHADLSALTVWAKTSYAGVLMLSLFESCSSSQLRERPADRFLKGSCMQNQFVVHRGRNGNTNLTCSGLISRWISSPRRPDAHYTVQEVFAVVYLGMPPNQLSCLDVHHPKGAQKLGRAGKKVFWRVLWKALDSRGS